VKPFYVYLLQCADGSYYTGQTDNMDARLQQHEAGQVGYTATRKPVALVWQGEFETREGAIAFEQRIKGWSRAKKEALMAGDWTAIQKLAWGTRNPFPTHLTPSIPQGDPSIPQGERGGFSQGDPSIPQDERGGVSHGVPREASGASFTVRPEVSKDTPRSVRPEVSKDTPVPSVRPGIPPPVRPDIPPPVRPEVSKDFSLGARNATPLPLGDPSIPQGERGGVSQGDPSIPQDVRGGVLQGLLLAILHGEAGVQRRGVAKAITLLESTRADHRAQADALLTAMLPHTGKSFRLGISGVPGVGKSTFIEVLGLYLIEQGHRVAVLTIDPSSTVSGGSILGDKTRMERLSVHARAYIRPSPSSGTLGGVAEKTREAMLVCEAAGYDVVIVETVGVGQSETAVANMTDMFVLMQLPNAGDDLQAIKKGVMELADLVVINKADIDALAATRAQAQISASLRLLGLHGNPNDPHSDLFWQPQVIQLSALLGQGVDRFWAAVTHYKTLQTQNGALANRRQQQSLAWMWERIDAGLKQAFRQQAQVQSMLPQLTQDVLAGRVAASTAARALLHAASMNSSAGMEPAQAPANHSTNPWTGTGPQGI
jgi:LAO/AO transport system kinase